MNRIIFDSRWLGEHGIGRFAREVRAQLPADTQDITGHHPVSPVGLLELQAYTWMTTLKRGTSLFYSPGYTPPLGWWGPFVFTLHDLIHVDVPEEGSRFKTLYYQGVVKPAVHRAARVFTDSEYSRQRILEWSGAPESQVIVVGCGVSEEFSAQGPRFDPGYPYILYVRNSKPHKNTLSLIRAFALLRDTDVRLLLSGSPQQELRHEALRLGVDHRVIFTGRIPEEDLPAYYRGAAVVTMPSLYEGFGLPPLEGMASGVPVVVSNTTSLPEVVGDAGLLVDPHDVESIADGLQRVLTDSELRQDLIRRGLARAALFSWDKVGSRVRQELAGLS